MATPTVKKFILAAAVTAALTGYSETQFITQSPLRDPTSPLVADEKSWEEYTRFYMIGEEPLDKVEILHRFGAQIIETSENLDPSIAKIINKNFSKLL